MSTLTEAADSLRVVSYRVKLEGKRTWYVDVLAMSPDEATRIALRTHTLACSAQCIGRSPESTYHGPGPGGRS